MTTNDNQKEEQRRIFDERMGEALKEKRGNTTYMTEIEHDDIREVVGRWETLTKEERRQLGTKSYSWLKKYAVVGVGSGAFLIYKDDDGADDDGAGEGGEGGEDAGGTEGAGVQALDTSKVVSHGGRMFDDLHSTHIAGGHCKARTFEMRLKAKFGKSIPRFAVRQPSAQRVHDSNA